jgi:hypothetical protein
MVVAGIAADVDPSHPGISPGLAKTHQIGYKSVVFSGDDAL